jgi:hypothetical protein
MKKQNRTCSAKPGATHKYGRKLEITDDSRKLESMDDSLHLLPCLTVYECEITCRFNNGCQKF